MFASVSFSRKRQKNNPFGVPWKCYVWEKSLGRHFHELGSELMTAGAEFISSTAGSERRGLSDTRRAKDATKLR